jgi:hypothetical protein
MIGASSPVVATSWSRCQLVVFVRGDLQNANGPIGGKPLIWWSDPRPICHKLYYRIEVERAPPPDLPRAHVSVSSPRQLPPPALSGIESYPSRVVRIQTQNTHDCGEQQFCPAVHLSAGTSAKDFLD